MCDKYDNDRINPKEAYRKRLLTIMVEELNSLLQDTYYRATLTCKFDGEIWDIIDRDKTPYGATEKVWATYMQKNVADWYIYGGCRR